MLEIVPTSLVNRMNENCPPDSFSPSTPPADCDSDPDKQGYRVLVANEQAGLVIDESRLVSVVNAILSDSEYPSAFVSIAVVDDPTIHQLNVQYLEHDYPTDVLSFVLEESPDARGGRIGGECRHRDPRGPAMPAGPLATNCCFTSFTVRCT